MNRTLARAALALALLAPLAPAQPKPAAPKAAALPAAPAGKLIPTFRVDGALLDDAVKQVADASGVDCRVDWGGFAADGMTSRKLPVTGLSLRNVSARAALESVADDIGGGMYRVYVDVGAKNELVLTTQAGLTLLAVRRDYDLGRAPDPAAARALVKAIQANVFHESWKDNGGPFATAAVEGRRLTITHTPETHRAIAALLADLDKPPAPAAVLKRLAPRFAALDKPVTKVNFNALPLADAVASLSATAGVDVVVMWRPLGHAGLDRKATVTVNLKQTTVAKALAAVFATAAPKTPVGVTAGDDGRIFVTTADHAGQKSCVVAYDVRPLVGDVPEKVEALERKIVAEVAPDSWWVAGGSHGNVQVLDGRAIVVQSATAQREVAAMLAKLSP